MAVQIRIAQGWYIHGPSEEEDGLIPTRLHLAGASGIRFEKIRYPSPEKRKFPYAREPLEVYSGEFLVRADVVVEQTVDPGLKELKGSLSYQACSDRACLPPEEIPMSVSFRVAAPGEKSPLLNAGLFDPQRGAPADRTSGDGWTPGAALWLTLVALLLGGLALNLTPCIYPLIPITVSYFGGRNESSTRRNILHSGLYIIGLALTNSLLGVAASLSGGMLGEILQNPGVLTGVAAILVWLGLSFFGVWEFRMPSLLTRLASRNYGGYFGTFFMGLTLGIVAAPCLGPFMLGLLTYVGQRGDPLLGFLYFFVLSVGMGLPLSILAVFSGALNRLPSSGEWMIWVRKFLGWVLLGMAGYMILPLIPPGTGRTVLLAALAAAAGVHLGWLDRSRASWPLFRHVKKGAGVLLIGAAVVYFGASFRTAEGIPWTPYNEALVAESRGHRPVILDFYADWCGPCVAMERAVFTDPEILELSRNFNTLRVDLTRRQDRQEQILDRYRVKGVPTVIFLNRSGEELASLRIETYIDRAELMDRMNRALQAE